MKAKVLKVHPKDNLAVALVDLESGLAVDTADGESISILERIPQKHKFATEDIKEGGSVYMYGVIVGKAVKPIYKGGLVSTSNLSHAAEDYQLSNGGFEWNAPDVQDLKGKTFMGYHRKGGKVGTRNYWILVPLVFCENRNIDVIKNSMSEQLGYMTDKKYAVKIDRLINSYREGVDEDELLSMEILEDREQLRESRLFPNVDGIKFLKHQGGCGGIRQDSEALCRLLAGYITHPNVAGATVLSLGCQMAQIKMLEDAVKEIDPDFDRPLYILEQQQSNSEREFISEAIKKTFIGVAGANKLQRSEADIKNLILGLECGGSDGFSGISANPALGHTSDLLVALGASVILSEFPELNGVEQELINRCVDAEKAKKFMDLMRTYASRAEASGSGFDMNPSPGNIKDGLITDAMKSAGAAKKGGGSPVTDVLDYTEQAKKPGLNLLCTPGNDVESTTGLAGSGANLIVFTTGLGTPTGNPVAPVVKISSNSELAQRMGDLIDLDTGPVIKGEKTVEDLGRELLDLLLETASGEYLTKAEMLGQDDFIPWKRGISL